ncbi:MAG: hypothetical protein JWQ71_3919 [Pedosphaera sp.]|nr:hypothetical protein [Pedosphaera sp.]
MASDLFEGGAVETVDGVQYEGVFGGGQGDEGGADGFGFGAAGGAGNASDGDGIVGTHALARAFGHFADDGFADGSVLREGFGADA